MWRIWTAIAVALLGPFQFGVALVVVNTMLSTLSEDLGFDENVGGAVATAALYLGAGVGGVLAGPFQRCCGKFSQVWIGVLYLAGSVLCGCTTDHKVCWGGPFDGCVANMLFVGRCLTGIASGLMLVISPKYLADVSPPSIRGALGASTQLCIAFGVFVGVLIGLPYEFDSFDIGFDWWRVMFLFGALPAVLQSLLMFLTFPLYQNSNAELRKSFKSASSKGAKSPTSDVVETTVDRVKSETIEITIVTPNECHNTSSESDSHYSRYSRCVILGVGVPVICQLIGIGIVGSYSTTIFEDAGMDHAIVGSTIFGLSNVLASALSVILFDIAGRITMATISFSGMGISYLALALSSLAPVHISGPLSVVFLIGFTLSFGAGCGALNLAYAPEVVPPQLANTVLGIGQSLSVFTALILVLIFPSVLDALGALWSFIILSGFCFGSLLFLRTFMIETKGRELDDILRELTQQK